MSAREKVLCSVELLAMIFAELSREDAAQAALVCRDWVELARDAIWHTVPDPDDLFPLLAPIETLNGNKRCFVRIPTPADWQRFSSFTRRVRLFEIAFHGDEYQDVLQTMSVTLPFQQHLLPRLEELCWLEYEEKTGCTELLCVLLSPTIHCLRMFTPLGNIRYPITFQFDDVIELCPKLRELELRPTSPPRSPDLAVALCRLLPALPLRELAIALYSLTPDVLVAATRCSTLEKILTYWHSEEGYEQQILDWDPCVEFHTALSSCAFFDALTVLQIALPLDELTSILDRGLLRPKTLDKLTIRCIGTTTRDSTRRFCDTVALRYPTIGRLNVNTGRPFISSRPDLPSWEPLPPSDAINMSDLSVLTSLTRLKEFEFLHDYPLIITDAELATFAGHLPQIQLLMLNPYMTIRPGRPTLTLNCLAQLAGLLPELKSLGLYFDTAQANQYRPAPVRFKSLRNLHLSLSPIPMDPSKEKEIALYLSTLLPEDVDFHTGEDHVWYDVWVPRTSAAAHLAAQWETIRERMVFAAEARRWVSEK